MNDLIPARPESPASPLSPPPWLDVLTDEGGQLRGVAVDPGTPYPEWLSYTAGLLRFTRTLQWALGDLILAGERLYGEEYSQVFEACDYADETLRVVGWVASRIPPVRRRTDLPWSHHREVAALDAGSADALLDRASSEGLSSREVRRLVAQGRKQAAETATGSNDAPAALPAAAPEEDDPAFVVLVERLRQAQKCLKRARIFDTFEDHQTCVRLEERVDAYLVRRQKEQQKQQKQKESK